MGDKIITLKQITKWLDELDESLKCAIVNTTPDALESREETYHLYQAAQLLRARMLGDFSETVEFNHGRYDD